MTDLKPKSQELLQASDAAQTGQAQYDRVRETLERDHYGSYVMINTATSDYVVAPTTSEVQAKFIARFGENAPGWCTRIGASAFTTI